MAALVAVALVAPLAVLGLGTAPATAATYRPFTPVFSTNTNGDVVMASNTLMTCAAGGTCATAQAATTGTANQYSNNNYTMRFVDVDTNPSTFNSSSATLTVPSGGNVLFAALVWGGRTGATATTNADPGARGRALFRVPGATGYTPVTASRVDVSPDNAYQSYLDVTREVAQAGSGTYTVADVQSSSGSTNQYAGWSLVVAVADPAAPARNLTVFTGFGSVATNDPLPTFTVSGFLTPPNGEVRTTLGAVTYEGDMGLVGDAFRLNSTTLSDPLNPADNPWNSSISRRGVAAPGRTPSYANQLGYDADLLAADGILPNSATSATITLTTAGDQYFPGVVTFATELYDPKLLGNKSVRDVDGGSLAPGDVLEYSVPVRNIGLDTAADSRFFDAIPTGTTYVPGSLVVDGVPQSDARGDDRAYYDGSANGHVVAHLGAGATPTTGGSVPIAPSTAAQHLVTFRVRVDTAAPSGADVVNGAVMTYRGATTLASASSASNILTDPVVAAPVAGNSPPEATPHVLSFTPTATRRSIAIDVLAGDTDPDGDALTVVGTTDAAGGSLSIGPDGRVTYAPRDDFAGRDVFTYTVRDARGLTSTASVQVDVVNSAPVAADDTATTPGGTDVAIAVLANDADANGDAISVRSTTTPANGTVAPGPGGALVYTPRAGFRGTDTFDYVVQDTRGGSDTGTVTVTVTNAAPVGTADTYALDAGGSVALAVLANDRDPEGDAITAVQLVQPANGTVVLRADGTGTYTPRAGFTGTDTFTYRVQDDRTPAGLSAPVTVTVSVNGVPVARPDTATVPAGDADVVVPVLDNDTDPEGGALAVTVAGPPAQGTAVAQADGTVRYTPRTGWAGSDSFTYRVTDPAGATATATVTVTTANTPPVAVDDTASTATSTAVRGVAVLANDTDVNVAAGVPGQALTVTAATADSGATVERNADGTLDVTPRTGFAGTVTVAYTVSDGAGGSATGTLRVQVANAAPTALPDGPVTTGTNEAVTVDVLANDTDANTGDTLVLVPRALTAPVDGDGVPRGTVTVVDGRVRYVPPAGWAGTVTFDYGVSDGSAESTAGVTVVVANAVPVADDFTATTPSGTAVELDALAHVRDANVPGSGQVLTVTGATADQGASVVTNPDGTLTLTPAPGHKGTVTVVYTAADGAGGTDTGTITVTVANAAPVATDASVMTAPGAPVDVDLRALASDANGDALTFAAGPAVDAAGTVRGTVTVTDGVATFTPAPGVAGTVTFPYTVSDGTAQATATVTVTVANAAPTAVADAASTPTDRPVTVDVLANDTDPNIPTTDQRLTVTGATADARAAVVVEADGLLTVTPQPGVRGPVTVTYTVTDGAGGTATGTLVVTVENAAPVAGDDGPVGTASGTSVLVDVLGNDTDANTADVLHVVPGSLSAPRDAQGRVQGDAAVEAGGVRYTPPAGFAGTVTFTYAVTDGTAADTATVTVVVANDAPVAVPDAVSTASGEPVRVDVVANDTDRNVPGTDQELRVVAVAADQDAEVVVLEDGRTVVVSPATGFRGDVTVAYTLSDGAGGTATGTLTVTVRNGAPQVGADGPVTTATDVPVTVDVLGNDSDANGDTLTLVPGGVSVPVDADGAPAGTAVPAPGGITFTPAPGFAGEATFTYDVTDGTDLRTGTVTVVVGNAAPVAADDAVGTATDAPVTVDVVANDTDANVPGTAQRLTVTAATASHGAAVVVGEDGRSLTVTPAAGFKGDVTVAYTVADGAGGTDDAVLTVTVANAVPVVPEVRDSVATPYGTPVVLDLLAGVTDANGDPLAVVGAGVPVDASGTPRGTVTVVDGVVTYTPPAGWSGTVTIGYVVSDGTDRATGTASVTVGNGAPVVRPDAATATAGAPVTIDVTANDADPEGGPLTIVDVAQPASGTVEVVDGKLVYTPAAGTSGTVTFGYTVADATGARTTATVTVEVAVAPAPETGLGAALARTGAQASGVAGAALLLLVAGAGLVVVRRRRDAQGG